MKDRHVNHEASIARILARISSENRAWCRGYLMRYAASNKGRSTTNVAYTFLKADQLLGKPFQDATPEDWQTMVHRLRTEPTKTGKPPAASSISTYVTILRTALKELHDVDALAGDLNRATKVRRPSNDFSGYILSDTDFHGLLDAANHLPLAHLPAYGQAQALLWFLWDSGTRISEAISLRIGDLSFSADGMVLARLPPSADGLKTGARTIPLGEAGGALQTWLAFHPAGHDPSAPLWIGLRCSDGLERASISALRTLIDKCADASGLNARMPGAQHLKPHDFRHTCATRKARAQWPEAKMRAFFGWSRDSDMPSRYIHLAQSDIVDQVRRDAGIDNLGYRQAMDAGDDLAAMRELLRRLVADPTTAATRRPTAWPLP